jgi:hypothetical protein
MYRVRLKDIKLFNYRREKIGIKILIILKIIHQAGKYKIRLIGKNYLKNKYLFLLFFVYKEMK